jgi:ribose 5-phosphate isomerase A
VKTLHSRARPLRETTIISMSKSDAEAGKKAAGKKAVEYVTQSTHVVGIGSGSTVVFAIEHLADRVKEGLQIVCIPTSYQSRELIIKHELPLGDLDRNSSIDVTIDGADEVDEQMNLIKGGGGCLLQEKIIASCSKQLIIVADDGKDSKKLGEKWKKGAINWVLPTFDRAKCSGVPIEVVPMARAPVTKKLLAMGAKSAETRSGSGKAGPLCTDSGNFIIDADFGTIEDPAKLERSIHEIVGVVEIGVFVGMASVVIFGSSDGKVQVRDRKDLVENLKHVSIDVSDVRKPATRWSSLNRIARFTATCGTSNEAQLRLLSFRFCASVDSRSRTTSSRRLFALLPMSCNLCRDATVNQAHARNHRHKDSRVTLPTRIAAALRGIASAPGAAAVLRTSVARFSVHIRHYTARNTHANIRIVLCSTSQSPPKVARR